MTRRNADVTKAVRDLSLQLTPESFKAWRNESYTTAHAHELYIEHCFWPLMHQFPSIFDYRLNDYENVSFKNVSERVRALIPKIPHLHLKDVDSLERIHSVRVRFKSGGEFEYDFNNSIMLARDHFSFDKLEPGMGDEMPYFLEMDLIYPYKYSSAHEPWCDVLPLSNDFYFHTHNGSNQVRLFFRDEEDFLEASLRANK